MGPPLILKRMFFNRWDGRWDEVGRPSPVFNGRNRPTPFGLYKIKKREGWGRRMGKVGAQDGPQSIVVKPRSYTGSVWHVFSTLVISTNYSFRSDSDQNE